MLKSIQKWHHNNFLKKYGFGWLYRDFFLHAPILLATYCTTIIFKIFIFNEYVACVYINLGITHYITLVCFRFVILVHLWTICQCQTLLMCTILILVNNLYLKIISHVYCVKTDSEPTIVIITTKTPVLHMKLIKFFFYRQF